MSVKVKVKTGNLGEYVHLPAIALRGLVIFPNSIVHFDVGREKSKNAITEAMSGDRMIYLVPQVDMDVEDPAKADVYDIGVVAEIKQVLKLQDGVVKVMVDAKYRAKTVDVEKGDKFLSALVKEFPVNKIRSGRENNAEALQRSIKEMFEAYLTVGPKLSKEVISNVFLTEDANKLCEYIAANIMFRIDDKMSILSENSLEKRMNYVLKFLSNEYEVLKIEADIKSKVHAEMDRSQKEYYLRQQMKTISEELDEGEDTRKESDYSTRGCRQYGDQNTKPKRDLWHWAPPLHRFRYSILQNNSGQGALSPAVEIQYEKHTNKSVYNFIAFLSICQPKIWQSGR